MYFRICGLVYLKYNIITIDLLHCIFEMYLSIWLVEISVWKNKLNVETFVEYRIFT